MSASADALLGAPLFVVGCPGSGTGLVGEILAAHGRIEYCDDQPDAAPYGWRLARGEVAASEARAFYLDAWRRRLSGRSPSSIDLFAVRGLGHALVVPFLAREFPDGRILHVLRDGRAVARVLASRAAEARAPDARPLADRDYLDTAWVPAGRRAAFEAATTAGRAALAWAIHVRAGLEGRAVAPDRYFEVRYEDLLADPAGWGGRVLSFAGVEMERGVERVLERIQSRSTAEKPQDGLDAHGLVEAEAGDLLRQLGYHVAAAS
jgi:hypothetical protein